MLETVARVPYFAYLSVLHLRESLGERSAAMTAQMNQHYAEADNELHHLLIVEARRLPSLSLSLSLSRG